MASINEALEKLEKSRFRSSFKLSKKDIEYIKEKGMDVVRSHTRDFVAKKLAPAFPENDGKQTPMHGHPAFKAMHACGCCCRGCLNKWFKVSAGKPLTHLQQEKIVNLLVAWMERQMSKI